MATKSLRLGQIRARLRKLLGKGWQRAVFRPPQNQRDEQDAGGDEQVLEGPGAGPLEEAAFQTLFAAMQRAAQEGRVKQVIVIHPTFRLEIDARHGSLKQRKQDEKALQKMMGDKQRHLRPDTSQRLLRELGLLNADGTMSRRHARKYKQVHHFVELCRPMIQAIGPQTRPLQILDLACGNSYLGFVLLEALRLDQIDAALLGVDLHAPWIDASRARAAALPQLQASFACASIAEIEARFDPSASRALPRPDLMVALHACDTASDDAIALALRIRIPAFLCAPCCHAELAPQLKGRAIIPGLAPLQEQGLFRRALGELVSDAMRVAWIEAHGYEVSLVEFVASEHSAKNLLVRARLQGPTDVAKRDAVLATATELGLSMKLLGASH